MNINCLVSFVSGLHERCVCLTAQKRQVLSTCNRHFRAIRSQIQVASTDAALNGLCTAVGTVRRANDQIVAFWVCSCGKGSTTKDHITQATWVQITDWNTGRSISRVVIEITRKDDFPATHFIDPQYSGSRTGIFEVIFRIVERDESLFEVDMLFQFACVFVSTFRTQCSFENIAGIR